MKRPVGVILASIVLGLFAALQLAVAALYVFLAFIMRHGPTNQPAQPGLPTGTYLTAIMAFVSIFFAVLAAWAIVTIVGLLRLRNWARYSMLVIGGCLAAIGAFSVVGSIFASAFLPANPATANLPPHAMQAVFLFMGIIYAAVAAIGIWWLAYFNLRSVKSVFLPSYPANPGPTGPALSLSYGLHSETWDGAPPPPSLPYRAAGRLANVPTSIIVIACLFLLGAVCCAAMALLPIPAFLLGLILHRPASLLLYLAFAAAAALIGIGLLRLDNRARLGVYAFCVLGIVNFLFLLTPGGQARYDAYQQSILINMQLPGTPPTPTIDTHALLLASALFCILFYGVQIWLIERHRTAFLAPPPPPTPIQA